MELKHIFENVLREAQCVEIATDLFNLIANNKDNLEDCEDIRKFLDRTYKDSLKLPKFFDGKIPNRDKIVIPKKVITVEENGEYFTSEDCYTDEQLTANIIHQLGLIGKDNEGLSKTIRDANIGKKFGDIVISKSHRPEAAIRVIAKPYVKDFMDKAKGANNFNNEIDQIKRDNDKLMYKIQRDAEKQQK